MAPKYGVICQRVVTSAQIDMSKIEFPEISDAVRDVILTGKIERLQGLLGEDWQKVVHQLAEEYWRDRD